MYHWKCTETREGYSCLIDHSSPASTDWLDLLENDAAGLISVHIFGISIKKRLIRVFIILEATCNDRKEWIIWNHLINEVVDGSVDLDLFMINRTRLIGKSLFQPATRWIWEQVVAVILCWVWDALPMTTATRNSTGIAPPSPHRHTCYHGNMVDLREKGTSSSLWTLIKWTHGPFRGFAGYEDSGRGATVLLITIKFQWLVNTGLAAG